MFLHKGRIEEQGDPREGLARPKSKRIHAYPIEHAEAAGPGPDAGSCRLSFVPDDRDVREATNDSACRQRVDCNGGTTPKAGVGSVPRLFAG